ncbi:MAG: 2-oxoacid:acceptor oxidoreductase family protein, partial [Alphaproteobacteria bacterium]|nr:2-oxoacid:acceptor oxidoreductase family protein [Alphaproteobacteria bacterium]
TRNVLIVGVGGQGVIMISKVLALLCQTQGLQVKQSEVHGMAKRGGVVFSHVRFGSEVWSPTIPMGEADVLIAMEWAEGVRWLPFLRPDTGVFIADTQQVIPPFACRNREFFATPAYATETTAEIIGQVSDGFALDAGRMAEELGNARAANTILLGTLSASLDFPLQEWLSVLSQFVPKGTEEINRQAFLLGREWVEKTREEPDGAVALAPAPAQPEARPKIDVRLEITREWCKSCDICVKLCPERCLELDEQQIVRLKDPDACTGCRICEWLCPDFAIAVHHESRDAATESGKTA